jgi:hypothetical protein
MFCIIQQAHLQIFVNESTFLCSTEKLINFRSRFTIMHQMLVYLVSIWFLLLPNYPQIENGKKLRFLLKITNIISNYNFLTICVGYLQMGLKPFWSWHSLAHNTFQFPNTLYLAAKLKHVNSKMVSSPFANNQNIWSKRI